MSITQKDKDNFFNLVDSLKKCRRADLSDVSSNKEVIEKLYVDPLDNDLVLKSVLKLNTTFLSGRRGTGKSTIIARLQHDIRKSKDKLSLYIDVKSVFEQSKAFSYSTENYADHFTAQELTTYLVYKSFLKEIISEVKEEIKTNTAKFYLAKITKYFGPDKAAFEEELNRIFDEIETFEYMDVEVLKRSKLHSQDGISHGDNQKLGASISVNTIGIEGRVTSENATNHTVNKNVDKEFSEALLKCFNPVLIMRSIKGLLKKIGINHVYICLDDFSEIDYEAMKVFVDVIIAPLNNLSDEFFKFKIAAYPGRIYLGDIDPTKIEQIRLDFYELYQSKTIVDVHSQAQESIKKLIEKRIKFFCKKTPEDFFDSTKTAIDDYYKVLFDITASVPRNVGWVLWYANQQSIAKNRKITINDLSIAAEKHYADTVKPYFSQNQFMREPFHMKLEKYHLHQLFNTFVESAKNNKREILVSDSKVFSKDRTRPPTSHFFINKKFEEILKPLEMQFFITKYNEQKDQDSSELMSFFSLNYGLCMNENLHYGRGSDRKYIIQRRFNNSKTMRDYLGNAKHIVCNSAKCRDTHDYEKLPMIEMFDMLCPTCKVGVCEVQHAKVDLPLADEKILLPEFDIQFINSLKVDNPQYPSGLARELDCTYQKVGKRASKLKEMGFLKAKRMTKDKSLGERNYYSLTQEALITYFETP